MKSFWLMGVLLAISVPLRAEEHVRTLAAKDFQIRIFRSGSGFAQTMDFIDIYPDGRLATGGQLSTKTHKRILMMTEELLKKGILKEGRPFYRQAHGGCVNTGSVVRVVYKVGEKTYTAGYSWNMLDSVRKRKSQSARVNRAMVAGLARLVFKSEQ
jgi:hypothetical protein